MDESKLYQRLDAAIERLTDVSNDIKQVLVVHETKLDQQDEVNRQYYDQIDKLHARIADSRDEIMKKIEGLEKWRWILLGGSLVIGIIGDNTDVAKLFR